MKVRRYYDKTHRGKTLSDEFIAENPGVKDTANTEVIYSREEQEVLYAQCVDMIMNNTRWVLDNLEYLTEFKVNWENYKKKPKAL
jgi:hypothetical protein